MVAVFIVALSLVGFVMLFYVMVCVDAAFWFGVYGLVTFGLLLGYLRCCVDS